MLHEASVTALVIIHYVSMTSYQGEYRTHTSHLMPSMAHCLSHDFTWSALDKQTSQLSLVMQQCTGGV